MASPPFRIAYIGGGSIFAPSVAHGVARALEAPGAAEFAVDVALVDAEPERAARMAAYIALLARHRRVPLAASVQSRAQALEHADLVLCSASLPDRLTRLRGVFTRTGWTPPDEGPGAVAEAVAVGPFLLDLSREVVARCPAAPLVSLLNPADVLAGAARRRFGAEGLRAAGLCPDVEGLRSTLAFLLGAPAEDIALVHGGVGHLGWIIRFAVGERDGYGEMGEWLGTLGAHPGLRPGDRVIPELYAMTGLIRSSAVRSWPFVLSGAAARQPDPDGGGRSREGAVDEALRSGQPIGEPVAAHPAVWPLEHAGAGRAVGRMVRAMATGEAAVVSLEVPYAGEALGWSPEVTVEVPAVVVGRQVQPMAVGPLPPAVDGLPRLLGQQRALAADYIAHTDLAVLRRALAATPHWGRLDQMAALAGALHEEFGPELQASAAGP